MRLQLGLQAVSDAEISKVQSTFEYFDADGNGCMDGPEFARMSAELASTSDRTISGREAFREIDADGSGSVEVCRRARCRACLPPTVLYGVWR